MSRKYRFFLALIFTVCAELTIQQAITVLAQENITWVEPNNVEFSDLAQYSQEELDQAYEELLARLSSERNVGVEELRATTPLYNSGLSFTLNEKRWEILCDIPGVHLSAEDTDLEYLAPRIVSLLYDEPWKYFSPSTETIRVLYRYDPDITTRPDVGWSNNGVGIYSPRYIEPGVMGEEILYDDYFLHSVIENNDMFFDPENNYSHNELRAFQIQWLFYSQLFYGGRLGVSFKDTEDPWFNKFLVEYFDLPQTASITQYLDTFRGLGVIIDPTVYPEPS